MVAPVDALIVPPPGGPGIISVVSTTFPNAIRQEISLATQARSTGENKISIVQFVDSGGDGNNAALQDIPFTQVNLTEEALAAWPDSGMSVSPYFVQNDYGPFGHAIGRPANGDVCIYAWQRIAPGLKPSGAVDRGTITVRFQMCKRSATEQELLEVMYRLRLKGSVHEPRGAPAAIGRIAAPIRPVGAEGFANVIDIPNVAPARNQAPAAPAAAPAAVVPVVIAPPPGAPLVPSPSGTNATPTSSGGLVVPRPTSSGVVVPRPSAGGQ
ncbi:MAG: cellulose biosynthesis protein BcsN [Cypionkella sp.]